MMVGAADRTLLDRLFSAIDSTSTEEFLACIAPDASFRFGSMPQVEGHAAIASAVEGFFSSIAALSHRVDRAIADERTLVCEGEVTYTRHDGSEVTLPFVNILDVADGLIRRYRIYIDTAPLHGSS